MVGGQESPYISDVIADGIDRERRSADYTPFIGARRPITAFNLLAGLRGRIRGPGLSTVARDMLMQRDSWPISADYRRDRGRLSLAMGPRSLPRFGQSSLLLRPGRAANFSPPDRMPPNWKFLFRRINRVSSKFFPSPFFRIQYFGMERDFLATDETPKKVLEKNQLFS